MSTDQSYLDIDVCGLEPPEPMERVLDSLGRLQPGQRLRVLIPREPFPLYGILDRNGYLHETKSREDFLYEVVIWPKGA
ncbi:MAG TPA: DUF2249 domain-containing protein [Noviherbaspirillum sp.]|nr:DUF2249 domain-containing protein [Noviherbaspirillum sp.]